MVRLEIDFWLHGYHVGSCAGEHLALSAGNTAGGKTAEAAARIPGPFLRESHDPAGIPDGLRFNGLHQRRVLHLYTRRFF
jgi:hypothetical protein